jgi:hypothetical protein
VLRALRLPEVGHSIQPTEPIAGRHLHRQLQGLLGREGDVAGVGHHRHRHLGRGRADHTFPAQSAAHRCGTHPGGKQSSRRHRQLAVLPHRALAAADRGTLLWLGCHGVPRLIRQPCLPGQWNVERQLFVHLQDIVGLPGQ